MWRSLAGQARCCNKLKSCSLPGGNLLATSPSSCSNGRSWTVVLGTRHPCTGLLQNPMASYGFLLKTAKVRCFASAAAEQQTVSSEEDVSAFEDGRSLQDARSVGQDQMVGDMSKRRYLALRRRQVKVETEAWEQAAEEYKELLADMCEQKLAPNLPYMKSLFLGWFEPLRDRIVVEQESCRQAKYTSDFTYHICQLPAEMMSVITMHKLMALLMTGGEHGVVRVVHAACAIGEAIEQEVGSINHVKMKFI